MVSNNWVKEGSTLKTLLDHLKTITDNSVDILCQNFTAQLDLLEFFLTNRVRRLAFVNCHLNHLPLASQIKSLCLQSCVVECYKNLEKYIELEMLTVRDCNLITVPTSIKQLQHLRYLNLNNNKGLSCLPQWINQLQLRYLSVNNCQLADLPDLLPPTLNIVLCENNKLQRLSPFLSQLESLMHFSAVGNPLTFPEYSINKRTTREIKQYLRAFLEDSLLSNCVKVSVIGQERAGKTSLVEAMKSSSGICDIEFAKKTNGLEISQIEINDLKLRVFDLAGDIEFIETHTMFLSEETLYLAVFDLRSYSLKSSKTNFLARIEIWLSSIFAQIPNAQVIIVGTHSDEDVVTPTMLDCVWQNVYKILKMAKKNHADYFASSSIHNCILCSDKEVFRESIQGVAGRVLISQNSSNKDGVVPKVMTQIGQTENLSKCGNDQNKNESCFDELCNEKRENNDNSFENLNTFKFPHIVGYFEVSSTCRIPRKIFSKQNISVEQLKSNVYLICKQLRSMYPSIPRKWINLQQVMLKQTEKQCPILSYKQFEEIAESCGISATDDNLVPFLRHFTSCGELLYYFDIEELHDVIIAEPQWLSNQLRAIISCRDQPYIKDGLIEHKSFKSIWAHLEDVHRCKLVHLFRQAGVFVPFSETTELIPCRLPIGRPSDDIWPSLPSAEENQVDYVVEFDNLPPSFFSHLISLVEYRQPAVVAKIKPLYLSNHIVYVTQSDGISCEVHTKESCTLNISSLSDGGKLTTGLCLARFLSLDVECVDSLLDSKVSLFRCSGNFNDSEALYIDSIKETVRHRIHFSVQPHKQSINISIRGPKPCCLAPETLDLVNRVRLTRYQTLRTKFYISCPVCIRKLKYDVCVYSMNDVNKIPPICSKGHDSGSWINILTGKCDFVTSLTPENIITSLTDSQSPRLFMLIPINLESKDFRDFFTFSYFKEGYSVHLLCEFPQCWHFLTSPGYRLSRPREFIKKYGNRLKSLLRILKSFETPARMLSPLFDPLGTVAETCVSLGSLATSLEMYLSDFGEEFSCFNEDYSVNDFEYVMSYNGLSRREFRRYLNTADEDHRFADLLPAFIGNQVMWVCEEHHRMLTAKDLQ